MYELNYSKEKNRIYIRIEGYLTDAEISYYIDDLIHLIDMTMPNFTVLADVTKSDISVLLNGSKFQEVRDYGATKGFKNVATVVSSEAYEIHKNKSFEGIKNVFSNMQDAEQYLDC